MTHTRDIAGAELVDYMNLPVESFALYDAELMRRIDADTFELRLPLRGSAGGLDLMQPTMRVRVTPSPETSSLLISSLSASLFANLEELPEPYIRPSAVVTPDDEAVAAGQQQHEIAAAGAAGAESGADRATGLAYRDDDGMGAEARVLGGIERGLRSASLSFNTTLAWRRGSRTHTRTRGASSGGQSNGSNESNGSTRLTTTVSMCVCVTCCTCMSRRRRL